MQIEQFLIDRIRHDWFDRLNFRNLEAHHIKPIEYVSHRILPYQNNSIDNGMLLCKSCHRREHRAMVLGKIA